MLVLTFIYLLSFLISALLLFVVFLVNQKESLAPEKLSPFECGFTPTMNSRMKFSIQFFLVTLIFLIFDVELILLFPLLPSTLASLIGQELFIFTLFVFLLTLGLIWEWAQTMLEWKVF